MKLNNLKLRLLKKQLLYARHCYRPWGCSSKQSRQVVNKAGRVLKNLISNKELCNKQENKLQIIQKYKKEGNVQTHSDTAQPLVKPFCRPSGLASLCWCPGVFGKELKGASLFIAWELEEEIRRKFPGHISICTHTQWGVWGAGPMT